MLKRTDRIEKQLRTILPKIIDSVWVNTVAGDTISSPTLEYYREMCQPASDLISRGGKRWRPLLLVMIAEAIGGTDTADSAYFLTPIVEFPHTGSLIIDDIEDNSDWRRGDAAVHKKYGTDISINAGNLLYYLPTVCIDSAPLASEQKLSIYSIYAKYLRRVHLGQGLDIVWHRNPDLFPSVQEYLQMCRFKTGCLAGLSAELGAAVAGGSVEQILSSGRIAEKIGVGFQIRDDVQNLSTGNPGKRRGDDIVEGKKSLPVILHVNMQPDDSERIAQLFSSAREVGVNSADQEIGEAINMITASGALGLAAETGENMLKEAMEEVLDIFPSCNARDEIIQLIQSFL
ncbi:MAG: polyprenyl synthetase family protein [Bacteroidetes bacterium]|nr:polyprenyl synthetase family protein [Bacteroidota bacterium]